MRKKTLIVGLILGVFLWVCPKLASASPVLSDSASLCPLPKLEDLLETTSDIDPKTYTVDNGDLFTLSIYRPGEKTLTFHGLEVRMGKLLLEYLGEYWAQGKSVSTIVQEIPIRYQKKFPQFRATINLGKMRTYPVTIAGKVNRPGQYRINPLTRLNRVIEFSCGLTKEGSRRTLIIKNSQVADKTIEFEKFLEEGDYSHNPQLKRNDLILVPSKYGEVTVGGSAHDTEKIEIIQGDTVKTVIERLGGISANAFLGGVILHRVEQGSSYVVANLDLRDKNALAWDTPLKDGDSLQFSNAQTVQSSTLNIMGEVKKTGKISITSGTTLKDVLILADGFTGNANKKSVLIERRSGDSSESEYIELNAEKVLDSDADPAIAGFQLKPGDIIRVPSVMEKASFVFAEGLVLRPGRFTLKKGMKIRDLLLEAGGPQIERKADAKSKAEGFTDEGLNSADKRLGDQVPTADLQEGYLYRLDKSGVYIPQQINLAAILEDPKNKDNTPLKSGDRLLVMPEKNRVYVAGNVNSPGFYSYEPGMTVKDLVFQASPTTLANLSDLQVKQPDGTLSREKLRFVLSNQQEVFVRKKKANLFSTRNLNSFMSLVTAFVVINQLKE